MPFDLVLMYQLLAAAKKAGKTFLAFYNCTQSYYVTPTVRASFEVP